MVNDQFNDGSYKSIITNKVYSWCDSPLDKHDFPGFEALLLFAIDVLFKHDAAGWHSSFYDLVALQIVKQPLHNHPTTV